MKRVQEPRRHSIEILFPVILFLVFAMTAISVILFAARTYRRQVESADSHYETRTSLEYLMQKVHRSDAEGAVSVTSFHGRSALLLSDTISGGDYRTYIYCDGNALRELYMRADAEVGPEAGTEIIRLSEFRAESVGNHLIRLTCVDEDNAASTALVAVRSGE